MPDRPGEARSRLQDRAGISFGEDPGHEGHGSGVAFEVGGVDLVGSSQRRWSHPERHSGNAEELTYLLDKTEILHGDGSNIETLLKAGLLISLADD